MLKSSSHRVRKADSKLVPVYKLQLDACGSNCSWPSLIQRRNRNFLEALSLALGQKLRHFLVWSGQALLAKIDTQRARLLRMETAQTCCHLGLLKVNVVQLGGDEDGQSPGGERGPERGETGESEAGEEFGRGSIEVGQPEAKGQFYHCNVMRHIKKFLSSTLQDEFLEPLQPQELAHVIGRTRRRQLKERAESTPQAVLERESLQQRYFMEEQTFSFELKRITKQTRVEDLQERVKYLQDQLQKITKFITLSYHSKRQQEIHVNSSVASLLLLADSLLGRLAHSRALLAQNQIQRMEKVIKLRRRQENLSKTLSFLKQLKDNGGDLIGKLSNHKNVDLVPLLQLAKQLTPRLLAFAAKSNLLCLRAVEQQIELHLQSTKRNLLQGLVECMLQFEEQRYLVVTRAYCCMNQLFGNLNQLFSYVVISLDQRSQRFYQQLIVFHKSTPISELPSHLLASIIVTYMQFAAKTLKSLRLMLDWHSRHQDMGELSRDFVSRSLRAMCLNFESKLLEVVEEWSNQSLHHLSLFLQLSKKITFLFKTADFHSQRVPQLIKDRVMLQVHAHLSKLRLSFNERLKLEEDSQWSRLPLDDNYSHPLLSLTIRRVGELRRWEKYKATVDERDSNLCLFQCEYVSQLEKFQKNQGFEQKDIVSEKQNRTAIMTQSIFNLISLWTQLGKLAVFLGSEAQSISYFIHDILNNSLLFLVYQFSSDIIKVFQQKQAYAIPPKHSDAARVFNTLHFIKTKTPLLHQFLLTHSRPIDFDFKECRVEKRGTRARLVSVLSWLTGLQELEKLLAALADLGLDCKCDCQRFKNLGNQLILFTINDSILKVKGAELQQISCCLGLPPELEQAQMVGQLLLLTRKDFCGRLKGAARGELPSPMLKLIQGQFQKLIWIFLRKRLQKVEKAESKRDQILSRIQDKLGVKTQGPDFWWQDQEGRDWLFERLRSGLTLD